MIEDCRAPTRRAAGYSLVELLIATAIGLAVLGGALQVYAGASRNYRDSETRAELAERAAFALLQLEADIALAGHWSLSDLPPPAATGINIHCGGHAITAWALQTESAIAARNGGPEHPCPADAPADSDGLTLRFATAAPVMPTAGRIQMQASTTAAALFADGIPPLTATPARIHDLEIASWYIDRRSSEAPLPALRRYALSVNGLLQNQEIMPGVRDLQIELGVDSDGDGYTDRFVTPEAAGGSPVQSVRVQLAVTALQPYANGEAAELHVEREFAMRNLLAGNPP